MRTIVEFGRMHAAYIDDGQGRRIALVEQDEYGVSKTKGVLALTRLEARHAAAVLRDLADELPDEPKEDP